MNITRREFVQRTATAVAAGCLAAPAHGEEDKPLPIVDTHQHLWDLDKFRLPWLKKDDPVNRTFLTKDYLEATRGLNVVKSVYMEVAVADDQKSAEARHVVELCRRKDNPTVAAVIGGLPGTDAFRPYILRFKDNPFVKGVRKFLPGKGRCLEKPFITDIRLLGELGMSFDLNMPAAKLDIGEKLVRQCPDTRFILDHCGNADPDVFRAKAKQKTSPHTPDQWRKSIDALAARKNVICKISGIVARTNKDDWSADDLAPIINHCLDAFGPDRVVFGGDWPVCTRVATFRQWVAALKQIIRDRPEAQQRKLLHDNAVRFYGL